MMKYLIMNNTQHASNMKPNYVNVKRNIANLGLVYIKLLTNKNTLLYILAYLLSPNIKQLIRRIRKRFVLLCTQSE